jgi:hypothetical protein
VIQIRGHHFHNEDRHKPDEAEQFVRATLVQSLLGKGDEVLVSAGPLAGRKVPVPDLGIGFPIIMESSTVQKVKVQKSRPAAGPAGAAPAAADGPGEEPPLELKRYDFTLQFSWQPTTPGMPKPAAAPAAAATEGQ